MHTLQQLLPAIHRSRGLNSLNLGRGGENIHGGIAKGDVNVHSHNFYFLGDKEPLISYVFPINF